MPSYARFVFAPWCVTAIDVHGGIFSNSILRALSPDKGVISNSRVIYRERSPRQIIGSLALVTKHLLRLSLGVSRAFNEPHQIGSYKGTSVCIPPVRTEFPAKNSSCQTMIAYHRGPRSRGRARTLAAILFLDSVHLRDYSSLFLSSSFRSVPRAREQPPRVVSGCTRVGVRACAAVRRCCG